MIDNAKKGAVIDSAYGYLDSVNKHFVEKMTLEDSNDNLLGSYYVDENGLKKFVGSDKKYYDISINGNKPTSGFLKYDNYKATGYLIIDEYKIDIQESKVIGTDKYVGSLSNALANSACNSHIYDNGTIEKEEYDLVCGDFIDASIYNTTPNEDGTLTITGFKDGVTDVVKNGVWAIPNEIGGKVISAIGEGVFAGKSISANLIIPNSVTSINDGAFFKNQLTGVEIPNSVVSIGSGAFNYNQLTSVKISDSVTNMGGSSFGNNQLTSVEIPKDIPLSAFFGNPLKTIIFREGWESIPDHYANNEGLTSITLPDSVTSIGSGAFNGNQLTSIEIPGNVTSIGSGAFNGNKLTSLEIPDSVVSISNGAFSTNQLKVLILGKGVVSIDIGAFGGNTTLTTIYDNSDSQIFVNEYKTNNNLSKFGLDHFNSSNTSVSLYDKSGNLVNISE